MPNYLFSFVYFHFVAALLLPMLNTFFRHTLGLLLHFFYVARCLFFSLIQKVEMWQEPKRSRGVKKENRSEKFLVALSMAGNFARSRESHTHSHKCLTVFVHCSMCQTDQNGKIESFSYSAVVLKHIVLCIIFAYISTISIHSVVFTSGFMATDFSHFGRSLQIFLLVLVFSF